jgi:serine protease Do
VPVNQARGIMTSLMNSGKVVRGYLGVMIQPITPELAKALKLPNDDGVLVGDVVEDGPAGKAGVKAGDVVVAFNGLAVGDVRTLRLRASQTAPGSKATLTVLRDGKEQRLELTVQELPGGELAAGNEPAGKAVGKARLGVRLGDLDGEARERFEIPRHVKGGLITEVLPGSRAADAGLKPGEVIVEVDRKAVRSAAEVSAAVAENGGDLVLRVWSKGSVRFVAVPAGAAAEVK